MVFFTCNNCGESVKKQAVEKHYQTRCRGGVVNVSCMDCLKDFIGDAFAAHTKCITEAQKYSGKDYVAKESKNSGAKKQESWMDIVRSILESKETHLSPAVKNAFYRLQTVDNVPRKKAKFENFTANCLRLSKPLAAQVWEVLEKELNKMKEARQQELELRKPGVKRGADEASDENSGDVKKKAKTDERKQVVSESTNGKGAIESEVAITEEVQFEWMAVIEKLVGKDAMGISIEKLQRKALKKYAKKLGWTEDPTEKQQKKFQKKFAKNLKNCPSVQVEGDVAKLS